MLVTLLRCSDLMQILLRVLFEFLNFGLINLIFNRWLIVTQ